MSEKIKNIYKRSFLDTVRVVATFFALIPLVYFLIQYYPAIVWETKNAINHFSYEQLGQTLYYYKDFVFVPLILLVSLILSRYNRKVVNVLLFVYLMLNVYCWVPGLIENGIPLSVESVPDMSMEDANLGFMNFYDFWADVSIMLFCISHVFIRKYLIKVLSSLAMLVMNIWRCSSWLYMILMYGVEKSNIESLFVVILFSIPMMLYSMLFNKRRNVSDKNNTNKKGK